MHKMKQVDDLMHMMHTVVHLSVDTHDFVPWKMIPHDLHVPTFYINYVNVRAVVNNFNN